MPGYTIATLLIIVKGNRVLLGEKLAAEIGTGKLNAPGGKWEDGESILECAVREAKEELGIDARTSDLQHVGFLNGYAGGRLFQKVQVYRTTSFSGEPQETRSMRPIWARKGYLPFKRMHEGDLYWFRKAVDGDRFRINLFYERPGEGYISHEFLDY